MQISQVSNEIKFLSKLFPEYELDESRDIKGLFL